MWLGLVLQLSMHLQSIRQSKSIFFRSKCQIDKIYMLGSPVHRTLMFVEHSTAPKICSQLDSKWPMITVPLDTNMLHILDVPDDIMHSQLAIQWQSHCFAYKILLKCPRVQSWAVVSLAVTLCRPQRKQCISRSGWPSEKSNSPYSSQVQQVMWILVTVTQMCRQMCSNPLCQHS